MSHSDPTDDNQAGTATLSRGRLLRRAGIGAAGIAAVAAVGPLAADSALAAAAAPVTITYMTRWDVTQTDPASVAVKQLIASFESQHPTIKVQPQYVSPFDAVAYSQKLLLSVTGGHPADV